MRTIFVLMDSLNRHFLKAHGNDWVQTPNLDRLAARGVVFDRHYCASLPCMPTRRDLMTGRLSFLETPWGPIEPWDDCLPKVMKEQRGIYSHMITDHYHYFHSGGECYHTLFDTWEFERGQEGDMWKPMVSDPAVPEKTLGKKSPLWRQDWVNRNLMDSENDLDYPTPRCFQRAIEFMERNHAADDWHLHLEVFDPHEPFMCPKAYRDLYEDTWAGPHYDWPEYGHLNPEVDDPEAVAHIRKCYAGALTMADAWLGKLLDAMDRLDAWKDTVLVLTTDHGHLLSERGYWGKNMPFDSEEISHIPMIVAGEGLPAGERRRGLTSNIDMMPTFLDLHGCEPTPLVRGRSIRPLFAADGDHHEAVLFGYFDKDLNLCDGRYTYCRQPDLSKPHYLHTLMPRGFWDFFGRDHLKQAEHGLFLPACNGVPHLRLPAGSRHHLDAPDFNPIYDLETDPKQENPIRDAALEERLAGLARRLLEAHDAPAHQYPRFGFA